MSEFTITRDLETGEFTVADGSRNIPNTATLHESPTMQAFEEEVDRINDAYDAGTLVGDDYNQAVTQAFDTRDDYFEDNTHMNSNKSFYGASLNINLGNDHDLVITAEGLASLAAIQTEELTSPQHVLDLDGVNRLIISPEVIQGLDPNAFRSETEVVGIDGGQIMITDTETYEMREADEWFNGEIFELGDENNTRLVLNHVRADDVGVQTLVIGDQEINIGERLERYNELSNAYIEVDQETALANGSYTHNPETDVYGIRDMEAVGEQNAILIGIHEDIRAAIIEAQANPSLGVKNENTVTHTPDMIPN